MPSGPVAVVIGRAVDWLTLAELMHQMRCCSAAVQTAESVSALPVMVTASHASAGRPLCTHAQTR